ncbi:AraC family transcriptional regulator [Marinobacter sp. R17]|nr:AraC family transcriptional regulator [Marinobacter sp. R17]
MPYWERLTPAMHEKEDFGTGANHYVSSLFHATRQQGVDPIPLLAEEDLPLSVIDQPEQRIPTEKLANFQKYVWDRMQDEAMGLAGCSLPAGTYYMMGQLTVHQPTLGQALALGCRFYNLVTRRELISLTDDGRHTLLSINLPRPELDYKHLFAEIALLSWHRYASWLIADSLPLVETRFNYPAPAHVGEYSYLYPGVHQFDCDDLSLVFSNSYLNRPVKQNEGSLKSFMNNCPRELFRRYKTDYSVTTELKRILTKELADGGLTIDQAAAALHMTTRTLTRRLSEEGASFQQIKNVVRRDLAIRWLVGPDDMAIHDVAERVGFSDPAVFTRAFRSWTGDSPRRYRDKFRQGR